MLITQDYIAEYFKDERNLFLIWNEEDTFLTHDNFYPIEYLSLFISLSGKIRFETHLRPRYADESHIQFFVKDISVRITDVSEDYRSVGILFSKRYWSDTLIHAHPYTLLAIVHPCLQVSDEEKATLMEFISFIRGAKISGKKDNNPVVNHIILGLFYQIGRMYETWSRSLPQKAHMNTISRFTDLLYKEYRYHRDVAFYADRLNMSRSHFSAIMKQSTGMTAFRCIEKYVVLKACSMLTNTDMSVKEIAIQLNFDDTSYFCKYFRKSIGQSPEEFRRQSIHLKQ